MKKSVRDTLSDNLSRFIGKHVDAIYPSQAVAETAAKNRDLNVKHSTLQHAMKGDASATIDTLENFGRLFKIEAWELLYPGMGPNKRPKMTVEDAHPWPFYGDLIPPSRWNALSQESKILLTGQIEILLSQEEERLKKRTNRG